MTKHVMLNNVMHKDLRVITRYGAQFGDGIATVMTFPTEFAEVQREYPIFFRKDPKTGDYMSVLLLGFSKDENLFLTGTGWDAGYIPGVVARGPFLIGFQEREESGELRKEPVIHVDLDSPRISKTEGELVFTPNGGNSRYLENVALILNGIHDGLAASKAMFEAFTALGLIEPVKLEVKFTADEQHDLLGLHTISRQKLANLDADSLYKLNRSGFLQGAFLVAASLNNVKQLIERKQRLLKRQAETAS